jgi:hypothetical protein
MRDYDRVPRDRDRRVASRVPAGLYNGYDYLFDVSDLRSLDTKLANACLGSLNYDRLDICDLDKRLEGGGRVLQARLRE